MDMAVMGDAQSTLSAHGVQIWLKMVELFKDRKPPSPILALGCDAQIDAKAGEHVCLRLCIDIHIILYTSFTKLLFRAISSTTFSLRLIR